MSVTIQIVGWNSQADLAKSLPILANLDAHFRYIDNNSDDESVALVKKYLPTADIIQLDSNTGFARAHNIGFAKCTTPYVFIHNPDLIVEPAGLEKLLHIMQGNTKIASLQGKIMREKNILDSTGIMQTLSLNGKERGAGEEDTGQYDTPTEILATTGAGSLYRLSALKSLPYIFDEDFFAYKEDVDLGWRLQKAGWRNMYEPVLLGYHPRHVRDWENIRSRMRDVRTRYSLRNYVWMLAKNVTVWQEIRHEPFILARLATFLGLGLLYPPFYSVISEIMRKLPNMVQKRRL